MAWEREFLVQKSADVSMEFEKFGRTLYLRQKRPDSREYRGPTEGKHHSNKNSTVF